MKEQNQGLALELNGLSFKPAMNPTSLVLASTMKSLKDRLPGMATKKEAALAKRREEVKHVSSPPPATLQSCDHPSIPQKEMEECTFAPNREGAKTSEKYLARMGRSTATPEDFFHYHKACLPPSPLLTSRQRKKFAATISARRSSTRSSHGSSLSSRSSTPSPRRSRSPPCSSSSFSEVTDGCGSAGSVGEAGAEADHRRGSDLPTDDCGAAEIRRQRDGGLHSTAQRGCPRDHSPCPLLSRQRRRSVSATPLPPLSDPPPRAPAGCPHSTL